jgi:hypothetical protein
MVFRHELRKTLTSFLFAYPGLINRGSLQAWGHMPSLLFMICDEAKSSNHADSGAFELR